MKLKTILAAVVSAAVIGAQAQTVSTVIRHGLFEPNSVAVDANDIYYLSSAATNQIVRYDPATGLLSLLAGVANGASGTNDSVGFLAQFNDPEGLTPARGGLVVADSGNHTLRFLSLTGSIAHVSTLAGIPQTPGYVDGPAATARFNVPVGLATDAAGNIYIADSKNNAIRKLDLNNVVSTVISNGLLRPAAVALDRTGLLYIADTGHDLIQVYNLATGTGTPTVLAGISNHPGTNDSYFADQAQFNSPNGLLWAGGKTGLLVSDSGNHTIRQIYYNNDLTNWSATTYAGLPGQPGLTDGALLSAQFNFPAGLATDNLGGLLVVDSENNALRRIQASAPQPPVPDPEIGYVTFVTNVATASLVSQLVVVSNALFFNDVTLAILPGDTTAQTFFTSGATPGLFQPDTIPVPGPATGAAPPPYADGLAASQVPPTLVGPNPDLTIKVISTASGRVPSAIVQARIQFKCGAPIILGHNPASLVLSNITTGAEMWYTLDGTDPTNSQPSVGPLVSGDTVALTITNDVTFKVRAFKANYQMSDISSTTLSPTDFLANRISFGFVNGEASSAFVGAAGQTFVAPVTLTLLPGQTMYSLQFYVTVTNLNNSPAVTPGAVGFESMLLKPLPGTTPVAYTNIPPEMFVVTNFTPTATNLTFTNATLNLLGVGWLERAGNTNLYDSTKQDLITYSQAHDTLFQSASGKVIVGGYTFQIPGGATSGQTYQIRIGRPSGTADGVSKDVYIDAPTNGPTGAGAINAVKNVTVGQAFYLVGDITPFRWFNAGDFGDHYLLNNDVLQVFQSVAYSADRPPTNSDFFNAMDSSNGTTNSNLQASDGNNTAINSVTSGDGSLNVDDVFVTFRRSLDPSLTWYVRYWSNGLLYATDSSAVGLTNTARNGGPDLPADSFSTQLADSPAAAAGDPPSVFFTADDLLATPGQTVQVPIRAQISGALPLRVLLLNLDVEPLGDSPPLAAPAVFTPATALGTPRFTDSRRVGNYAAAWLDNSIAGLGGNSVVGTLQFTVPANATPSSAYRIAFAHASASPNGLWLFPRQTQPGVVTLRDATASSLGDGIPDLWRLRYFGSVSNLAAAANADADGDGMSNAAEFLAGTDPTDPKSALEFALVQTDPAQRVTVHWPSVAGKQYIVETSTSAAAGSWNAVSGALSGTGHQMSFTDNNSGAGTRFYRLRLGP